MFYKPTILQIRGISVIVYPEEGIESFFDRKNFKEIDTHMLGYIGNLYSHRSNLLEPGEYNIIILWKDDETGDIMVDMWIYDQTETYGSGALVDVKIFRGQFIDTSSGVSAVKGLILLGREGELAFNSSSVDEYINGPRPELPEGFSNGEDYYITRDEGGET